MLSLETIICTLDLVILAVAIHILYLTDTQPYSLILERILTQEKLKNQLPAAKNTTSINRMQNLYKNKKRRGFILLSNTYYFNNFIWKYMKF